jgi:lambda family phage portal protein
VLEKLFKRMPQVAASDLWAAEERAALLEQELAKVKRSEGTPGKPTPSQLRQYAAARATRLNADRRGTTGSADSELYTSLRELRDASRALVRDASYAKRAKRIVVNNVIGAGVGMQGQIMSARDALRGSLNDSIEASWCDWSRAPNCHTGGKLSFADIERVAFGQIFEAGEIALRVWLRPFGESRIPLGVEVVESERFADQFQAPTPAGAVAPGAMLRMGVEVDDFYRPLAYWLRLRHPGELMTSTLGSSIDRVERVPSRDMFHLYVVDRWPQTRGVPWMNTVIKRMGDIDGYSEAEIVAARGAASYMATIESPDGMPLNAEEQEDGTFQTELTPGLIETLPAGYKLNFVSPNRPNAALDPFMRYMLREIAAGADVSYESLSRDYSQSNYSSSRLGVLDDRDLWRTLQLWWIRNFREPFHRLWMQQAALSGAIAGLTVESFFADPAKHCAAVFKPRGWSWIDPAKEVEARKAAVRAGFDTVSNVIAETANGRDLEDVIRERKRELEMIDEAGLTLTTDPAEILDRGEALGTDPAEAADPEDPADDGTDKAAQPAQARGVIPMRGKNATR